MTPSTKSVTAVARPSVPEAPAGTATLPWDINQRWIDEHAAGVVVIHPHRIAEAEALKGLPLPAEWNFGVFQADPRLVERLVYVVSLPPDTRRDETLIVARLAKPIDQPVLEKLWKGLQSQEHAGKTYYVVRGGRSVFVADEMTLVIAEDEDTLKALMAGGVERAGTIPAPTAADLQHDVYVAFKVDAFGSRLDWIQRLDQIPGVPPAVVAMQAAPALAEVVSLRGSLSGPQLLELSSTSKDEAAAEKLEKLLAAAMVSGKELFGQVRVNLPKTLGENGPPIVELADEAVAGLKLSRQGARVSLSLPRLAKLTPAADRLWAMTNVPVRTPAQRPEWKNYDFPAGGYSIEFPLSPGSYAASGGKGGESVFLDRGQNDPHISYEVTWSDLTSREKEQLAKDGPAALLPEVSELTKEFRLGEHHGRKRRSNYSGSIAGGNDYIGVQESLYVLAGARIYQVSVSYPEDSAALANADRFLNSFKIREIVAPAATPEPPHLWTDRARNKIKGHFVEFKAGQVMIQKADGEKASVPLADLIEDDTFFALRQAVEKGVLDPVASTPPGKALEKLVGKWWMHPDHMHDIHQRDRELLDKALLHKKMDIEISGDGQMTLARNHNKQSFTELGTWKPLSTGDRHVLLEFTDAGSKATRRMLFWLSKEDPDRPLHASMNWSTDQVGFSLYKITKPTPPANLAPKLEALEKLGATIGYGKQSMPTYVLANKKEVTDETLALLEGFPKLETLRLSSTSISDDGLAKLRGLEVGYLDLNSTNITDAGIEHLTAIKGLRSLDLKHTKVTDAGLASVAKITTLKRLELANESLTDAGLKQLEALEGLEHLELYAPQVTLNAWLALRKRLPKLHRSEPEEPDVFLRKALKEPLKPLSFTLGDAELQVDAPADSKVAFEEPRFDEAKATTATQVALVKTNQFELQIFSAPLDLAKLKIEEGLSIAEITTDQPDRMIWTEFVNGTERYCFAFNKKIGDATYGVASIRWTPEIKEQRDWVLKAAESLRAK